MTTVDQARIEATDRLERAVPGSTNIQFYPSDPPFMSVGFELDSALNSIRLKREGGLWSFREWLVNGKPRPIDTRATSPRFEALVAETVGAAQRRPHLEVKELRCPNNPRRMFAKIILQKPLGKSVNPALIEVSCSQCKHSTGHVTMHLFDVEGELVRTELTDPYVRREPNPRFGGNGSPTTQQASERR